MLKFRKIASFTSLVTLLSLSLTAPASAHVIVTPKEVTTATVQAFSVSVPNEKTVSMVNLKLDIPDGLESVTPTAKAGWTIIEDKTGEGRGAMVKSIIWSGGSLPADQRDDFGFSAKSPDKATKLGWKAYQTYEDGSVTIWDQEPTNDPEAETETNGPYSVTDVVSSLATNKVEDNQATAIIAARHTANDAHVISLVAIILAVITLSSQLKNRRKKSR